MDRITRLRAMIYTIPQGAPVYVANRAMILRKHTTKKITLFSREQLVIGEKMKDILPFKFAEQKKSDPFGTEVDPPVTATLTQLFDLDYYTFKTDIVKWPWMVIHRSVFEDQLATNPELERIKKALSKLWIDEATAEADAKGAKEKEEEENTQIFTEEDVDKLAKAFNDIEVLTTKSPLSKTEQKKIKRTQKCPDCAAKGKFLEGPSAGVSTNFKCGECGSKFNTTPFGIERS